MLTVFGTAAKKAADAGFERSKIRIKKFAFLPKKLEDGQWVWLQDVWVGYDYFHRSYHCYLEPLDDFTDLNKPYLNAVWQEEKDMSEWHEPKNEDIDIDWKSKQVDVYVKHNDFGAVYVYLSFEQIINLASQIQEADLKKFREEV